jgi:AraC-like DNA-binding protein
VKPLGQAVDGGGRNVDPPDREGKQRCRRLEGVTFSELLKSLRTDLARRYLDDGDLTISQIAWLLGYQPVGAFSHASKRWTGETPGGARPR